jgi:hypothetical protein
MPLPSKPGSFAERALRRRFIVFAVGFYLVMCVAAYVAVLHYNHGKFMFYTDDPYIHLALAQQIMHGHYGINVGEAASPSSSILWPFLIAPLTLLGAPEYGVLLLNVLLGCGVAAIVGVAVAQWPGTHDRWRSGFSIVALLFCANAVVLTFLGMEHMLQVLLAVASAMGIVACLRGKEIPWWCIAAAAIGPLVRYECLGITFGVCVALWGERRWRTAVALAVGSVLPVLGFSLFLHSLGLPWLPTSVMVKSGVATPGSGPLVAFAKTWLHDNLLGLGEQERGPVIALFLVLVGTAWTQRTRVRRFAVAGAAVAVFFHMLIGHYGWFTRYEVYVVIFAVLVVMYVMHEGPRMFFGWYAMGFLAIVMPFLFSTHELPRGSHEIYAQQYQTHRFFTEFYKGNVGIDDLGVVSFNRRPGQYVLDLYGLGSVEAAMQAKKDAAWLDAITRKHDVGMVVVFSIVFPDRPQTWTTLGKSCIKGVTVVVPDPCVMYYATGVTPVSEARAAFEAFVKTLPADVMATEYR